MSEQLPNRSLIDQIDPNGRLAMPLLGTDYRSALIVASGTLVEQCSEIDPYIRAGAGAVIPRSTRFVMERFVHPSPHLYQDGRGSTATMLNGEWTGADINYWRPHLDQISADKKTIMSVSGRDIEGCITVCKELDSYDFPLLEVNISCGISNGMHGFITRSSEHIERVCSGLKEAGVKTPIAIKLGHSDGIVELAGVAKASGADAISAVNTYGPVFDFRIGQDGKPERVIGAAGAKGGLSGNALFNIALNDVADISRQIEIPVLASGGVMNAERAVKMIMAGASLVQLYTVLHEKGVNAPDALTKFSKELIKYMDDHQIEKLSDVLNAAHTLMDKPTDLTPKIPVVESDGCIGCDACVRVCLPSAFDIIASDNRAGHIVAVNDACVGCGHCISECPVPGVLTLPQ